MDVMDVMDESVLQPATTGGRPPKRLRLDVALVARGLETSRERARRLILAGEVAVGGQVMRAPSTLVPPDVEITIGKALPYVSRGGLKLAHALDRFGIDVAGRICLDAGAGTGGFTEVLLERGAARVYAVDVGKGVLAWKLRHDPRVVAMEGVNARYLHLAPAAESAGAHEPPATASASLPELVSLATIDLAFISLRLVLPAITRLLTGDGEVVALVKPQFEAGPTEVGKGGVVRRPQVHRRVLAGIIEAAQAEGLHPAGLIASPIRGQAGNVEFLLWARRLPGPPWDTPAAIDGALAEAQGLSASGTA